MNWINAALLSAGILGIVNVIDSHLISRRMPSFNAFLLPVSVITLAYGVVILFLFPFPEEVNPGALSVAVLSAIVRSVGVTFMLYALTTEDVSRVIPVINIYPIFVAIMAIIFLDESLNLVHWLAVVIVVSGAVLVSLRQNPAGGGVGLGKMFGLLFLASLFMAGGDVTSKYALNFISYWNMYSIGTICMSASFLAISLRGRTIHELKSLKGTGSALTLIGINETLSVSGIILSFWAIERGPVSLVSTILSSRPIFVFFFAAILSQVWPAFLGWRTSRTALSLRLLAIAMIIGGITIIQIA